MQIDKQQISQKFSRSAGRYAVASRIQVQSAERIAKHLARYDSQDYGHILDIGVGTGQALHTLEEHGYRFGKISGVDFAPGLLALAQQHWPCGNFILADAETYPFQDAAYDCVISNFALQWFQEPALFLQKILAAVIPGGKLIVALPIEGSLQSLQNYIAAEFSDSLPLYPLPQEKAFGNFKDFCAEQGYSIRMQKEFITEVYANSFAALQSIKAIGADFTPNATPNATIGDTKNRGLQYKTISAMRSDPREFCLRYLVLFILVEK